MSSTSSASQQADEAAESAALKDAKSSGEPVPVTALTTATDTTTANPDGELTYTGYVLPVRVQRGKSWVPVSTKLARGGNGMLVPAAVPGDNVEFSDGGSRQLAQITADGTSMSLSWPGRVPAPVVSGSSAEYDDILPGVNLILTATSDETGGFSSVIEVTSAAAAKNPVLARLELAVKAKGVTLRQGSGGSLVASGARTAGQYVAAAPEMWDSSSLASGASGSAVASAGKLAKSLGASLAPAGLAGPRSTFAGPSRGARMARVGTSVSKGGGMLSLVPDSALLSSKSTKFPLFIDPSFSWSTADGSRMNYDEEQSACPTASHYDTTDTTDYWSLGVGYDGFGDDCNGANGYAYSYYEDKVPSSIWGGYIYSASLDASEAYTASCSASADVTLSQTGGINSSTDWDNMPGVVSNLVTDDIGPGPTDSCNDEYDETSSDWKGLSFAITSTMAKAASADWSTFTFRFWENGNSNDVDWKRFGKNPFLQVTYEQPPDQPSGLEISTGGAGSDCTSSPYPWVGDLDSTGGTTMEAVVKSPTGDDLEGIFEYQKGTGSGSWTTVDSTSTALSSGAQAKAVIPASFTNSLADGTEVTWRVEADNGAPDDPDSIWSAECHFDADPTDPPAPTVTAGFTSDPAAGTQVSFTITSNDPASDPAAEFVWGLDKTPASASPAAAQVITLTKGETSATVEVNVPGPGPHALYAYATDAAGNDSAWSGTNDPASFSATADSDTSYASFSAALTSGSSFDNTMISENASNAVGANGDGNGDAFSEAELKSAGWTPGSTVTVDGAQFTLPQFGSGAADNILAANQTIDLPAGSQGTSLVFLATSTNGGAASPDAGTLAQDQQNAGATGGTPFVAAAPYVAGGSAVTGYECDTAGTGAGDCALPTGSVNYASGTGESYGLTVPNWAGGPAGPAAMATPDRLSPTGVLTGQESKIYAFAVPLDPTEQVTSVTLPDVGSVLSVGGISYPALHIFGVAVANTTTATPGSSATLPSGQSWTGAWASPSESAYEPPASYGTTFSSDTFRVVMQASAGGSAVRLRLSDDLGWLAGSSGEPLDIGDVTVAPAGTGAAVTGTPVQATFGGSSSVTIPEGGDVYSDPVDMTVTPGEQLAVSIYLANGSGGSAPAAPQYLVEHTYCSACTEYVAADKTGDQTASVAGSQFSGTGTIEGDFSDILTGVDVETAGTPTVAVLGDGLIDASATGSKAAAQGTRISDVLAGDLQQSAGAGNQPAFGVIGEGIESNQVLTDADDSSTTVTAGQAGTSGGPAAVSRLARDILADPGVGTVIVDEGLEDLLQAGNNGDSATIEADLYEDGYNELANLLNEWGITVIFATMTPCSGYAGTGSPADACTTGTGATVDTDRFYIDYSDLWAQWGNMIPFPGLPASDVTVDFDSAVSASPYNNGAGNTLDSPVETLASGDNAGDGVNLTNAGYQAAAASIPSYDLVPAVPPAYGS